MYSSNIRPGFKDKGNYGNQKQTYKPIKNKYIQNLEKKNDQTKNLVDIKIGKYLGAFKRMINFWHK
jgi:hypothetical protein